MPTYPLTTLAPTVSSTGIAAVALEDIIQSLIASAQAIFGSDIYLDTDSQDYQLLAVVAQAIYDSGMALVGVYNQFSPQTAVGTGLSNVVLINGIERILGSNSQALVQVTGTVGSPINNGVVEDGNGNLWSLPASVTIPTSGEITVTATCQTAGAITAPAGAVTIYNPQLGWQTATFTQPADTGTATETDAALRQRQTISTAIPALTSLGAIQGAIANIAGVSRSFVYENDTDVVDENGLPPHSIAVVVEGGSATTIAQTIELKKNVGCGTYGTTTETVEDPEGLPLAINFFELTQTQVYVAITITPLNGYADTTGVAIIAAVVNYINALAIGEEGYQAWVLAAASLIGTTLQQTFVITGLTIGTAPGALSTNNIATAFNAALVCSTPNVTLTVA